MRRIRRIKKRRSSVEYEKWGKEDYLEWARGIASDLGKKVTSKTFEEEGPIPGWRPTHYVEPYKDVVLVYDIAWGKERIVKGESLLACYSGLLENGEIVGEIGKNIDLICADIDDAVSEGRGKEIAIDEGLDHRERNTLREKGFIIHRV